MDTKVTDNAEFPDLILIAEDLPTYKVQINAFNSTID